ncbi:MAG: hypothetical protein WC340_02620 [Kiritimatiellia bacterium]
MGRIFTVKGCIPDIGLRSRCSTPGAETLLVNDFIDFYCSRFLRNSRTQNLAIFVEPKLESGFPDLVIAHYTPSFVESSWTEARDGLNTEDLKVLSFLIQTGGSSGENLISKLRLPGGRALHSLEKLLDTKWVSRKDNCWKPSGMKQNFGLKKLVAIEAKISDISKVTAQAVSNVWFASHSYALIDTSNPRQSTLASFDRLGVGLYCKGKHFRKALDSRERPLPSSYASLLFNEWVAKSVLQRKAI